MHKTQQMLCPSWVLRAHTRQLNPHGEVKLQEELGVVGAQQEAESLLGEPAQGTSVSNRIIQPVLGFAGV